MVCVRADGDSREKPGSWRKWDMWEWQTPQSRLILCPRSLTLCSYLDLHTSCHSYLECWSCNTLISKHTGLAWFSFLINTFMLIQKQFTSGCHRKKKYERRLGLGLFDWCLKFIGVKRCALVHTLECVNERKEDQNYTFSDACVYVCVCHFSWPWVLTHWSVSKPFRDTTISATSCPSMLCFLQIHITPGWHARHTFSFTLLYTLHPWLYLTFSSVHDLFKTTTCCYFQLLFSLNIRSVIWGCFSRSWDKTHSAYTGDSFRIR